MYSFISSQTALEFLTLAYVASVLFILLASKVCLQIIDLMEAGE